MAANSIAKLAVLITGDASPLRVATQQAAQSIQSFAVSVSGASQSSSGLMSALAGGAKFGAIAAGATAAAAAVVAFGKAGLTAAANMEQLAISMEVMTGSAQKASDLISDMQKLSVNTPLNMADIQQAGKTLLAMGEPVEGVISDLKMLGDVASGTGQPLNELAQVFGQVMQAGRLTGNELRQFNERGIPLLGELSKQLGVSKSAIRSLVEDGQISSQQVAKAFEAMTSAGGMFANMMERQTNTLIGQWNKFKENLTIVAMNSLEWLKEDLTTLLYLINQGLDAFMKWRGISRTGDYKTENKAAVDAIRQQETAQKDLEETIKTRQKTFEDMAKRAESVAKSLRTPFEVMKDSLRESAELLQAGLLGPDMYARSVEKIGDEFKKATARAAEMKNTVSAGLQRGSVAEFTARIQSTLDQKKEVDELKKNNELTTKILEVEKNTYEEVKKNKPGIIKVGRLT